MSGKEGWCEETYPIPHRSPCTDRVRCPMRDRRIQEVVRCLGADASQVRAPHTLSV